jgi:DNA-binding Xre family transcriptional regulator
MPMENQIKKLKSFYGCTYLELAKKIGITERQLQNVRKDKLTGKFLKMRIEDMIRKIESL